LSINVGFTWDLYETWPHKHFPVNSAIFSPIHLSET
jgi:hypothetical protein